MHAFFDSPDTIRNKVKEFKTATLGGLNKQDVMNYLSLISEQQGVMIRLLRENNIPLNVDDGYDQEEQFIKPTGDGQDALNLNQYLGANNGADIAELQAEIEALKAENNELRLASYNTTASTSTSTFNDDSISDFDSQFGLSNSNDDEKAALLKSIEEKDLYIKELEKALDNPSSISAELNIIEESNATLTDIERQAYEEEIVNLREELERFKSNNSSSMDLFNTEVVSLSEDMKDSYEREIESLKTQLSEALASQSEAHISDLDLNMSDSNTEEVASLKAEINTLTTTISELQSEIEVYHELLNESSNDSTTVTNSISDDTKSNSESELEHLKTTIEVLELEISKAEREKSSLELKLSELSNELSKYSNFTDENGTVISLTPSDIEAKYKELLDIQNNIKSERADIESKLALIQEKEALIESNKHLVSEDFVNNITKKEQEIESLRKQMDRMLVVAQATADATENEAKGKATALITEATEKAQAILDEANVQKTTMLDEANETLNSAKEFKASTEEELTKFREETRQNAEEIILDAQNTANSVIEAAHAEAQKSQDEALEEVQKIMSQAEQKMAEIDGIIQAKQKEIDNMQTYYLKVKNDGLVGVKKLYNQLENIIYSDELS